MKRVLFALLGLLLQACGPAPNTGTALESVKTESGIIGGRETIATDFVIQYTVALYDPHARQIRCTGTLVGNNLVLTAAHCLGLNPQSLYVLFTQNLALATQASARPVIGAIAYPTWGNNRGLPQNTGDIALIKYQGATPPGYKGANVIANTTLMQNGSPVLLAGFGISDGVRKKGSGVLRQVTTKIADIRYSSTEITIDQRQGLGACNGDSGGPAYVQINNIVYFWGVSSRAHLDTKGTCTGFSIYTSIVPHLKWLQDTARSLIAKNQFVYPKL
ncbi:MAG: trypsin-like serine protease [Bdellovibrionaceae bacterium]|nr:trypsin-like serine protease [Pseudobdellovibrionaceae bacterium]